MKKLLDFLEELRDKYKEEYLYNEKWESTSIDMVVSREDKYKIAQIIVEEKVKLRYIYIMVDWVEPYPYINTIKLYKEMMKSLNVIVSASLDLLEKMIYAEGGERYKRFLEEYKESKILKDEYTMNDEEYREYSEKQNCNLRNLMSL
ncbi:hypothetical protein [Clostridium mediterraneense]|uniref:hypothetical protein n=1 Tax=Clostridium mediterraneense TaxID=1805472 RepID=UPI000832C75C|nr:hypothetical protein [Clostridium mediterraneense]